MLEQSCKDGFEHIREPLERFIEKIPRPNMLQNLPREFPGQGEPDDRHVYTDETGKAIVVVYRYDKSDNRDRKEFRPFNVVTRQWRAPSPRPLYRLDAIARYEGAVVLVEGEKCADALNEIGILATTAFGGCNGVGKTDFKPLKGRDVIIWPDNDEPGRKYAEKAVVSLAKEKVASIRIVPLDQIHIANDTGMVSGVFLKLKEMLSPTHTLRKGWDAADAISEGWDSLRIRRLLSKAVTVALDKNGPAEIPLTLTGSSGDEESPVNVTGFKEEDPYTYTGSKSLKLKETESLKGNDCLKAPTLKAVAKPEEWGRPDMSVLNPRRKPPVFPSELFGPFWAKWIMAKAEGCSAPVDYVGMSLLSLTSTLIGCARFVSPWQGWKEPPILWVALVGNPSSGKSPALESVLSIARKIEQEGAEGLKGKLRQYEADRLAALCVRQDWEKQVKEATKTIHPVPPLPEAALEPAKPERPRIMASDTTPEALARLLACQPKGLLITRDELAGWLGSFNRYSGGQGGDRAFWLEAYGGKPYVIDRARNGGETVTVPNLAASIIGGIQPDKLHSLLLTGDDDGLPSRFLFCWPDPVPLERPHRLAESFEAETALRWLNGLSLIPDGYGGFSHGVVKLSEDAANFFQDWRAEHAANQPDGAMASWWGKMPGVCLRLALCFEYLWLAATTRQENFVVTYAAVEAATVMIEQYLKPMAAKAYGDAALPQAERNAATLAKWIIKNKVERINTRELQRNVRLLGLRTASEIRSAIKYLVEESWLYGDFKRGGKNKGRLTNNYQVNPKITV